MPTGWEYDPRNDVIVMVPHHRAGGRDCSYTSPHLGTGNGLSRHEIALGERLASFDINDIGAQQRGLQIVVVTKEFFDSVIDS
ncbi:hypothetical protein KB1_20060 [Cutibacterium modestum]|uniref:Uncharacterized protein n=2 Tax=Cutibacterium modestum TaxID=2559073 RepID=A0AAD1NWX0_9ACTN|nr:hypothetical protein KB1_20060 [Cutibacterium modestum]